MIFQEDASLNHGDLTMMLNTAGFTIGISAFTAGTIIIPLLGKRVCLMIGCFLYILASFLSYAFIDFSVSILALSYGCVFGTALSLIMLPTILMPVTWYPESKGKVVGFTMSGFGLSSLVFAPLQTHLINPNNIPPVLNNDTNGSSGTYFTSPEVLSNLPSSLLYLTAIYSGMLVLGCIVCVEKEAPSTRNRKQDLERLKNSLKYLVRTGLKSRDFYALWITRYAMLSVSAGVLVHWKTFSFEVSSDDKLISIIGGITGILNAASRIFGGTLMDRISYRYIMVVTCGLLCICFVVLVPTAYASFQGYVALILLIFFLSNSFFTTIPTQVVKLFGAEQSSIILGALGFSDSTALATSALLNLLFKTQNPFLPFFLSMAGFALLATVSSALTRENKDLAVTESMNKQETEVQK